MGFTREYPLHVLTRRLWSWRDEFGNERFWSRWLGGRLQQRGAEALWPFVSGFA
jgi:acyl-CoA dehydrogenase